jgi:HEAT repeat protein
MGPAAVPRLLEVQAEGPVRRRQVAARVLAESLPQAVDTKVVEEGIESEDETGRELCIAAAAALGAGGERFVPALIHRFDHADRMTRCQVLAALGRIGRPVDVVLGVLVTAARKHEWKVRAYALDAMETLGPPAWKEKDLLVEALGWPEDSLAQSAILAIGAAAPPEEAVRLLVPVLDSPSPLRRVDALLQIGRLETAASSAAPRIRRILREEGPMMRYAACVTLGAAGDRKDIEVLRVLGKDPDAIVRGGAMRGLEMLGELSPDERLACQDAIRAAFEEFKMLYGEVWVAAFAKEMKER